MASVSINNVRKDFGAVQVLHDVSLDIADGEFIALVGPSGCGKSTLLRILAGLEHADGGEIRIGPRNVSHMVPKHRDIAMVFQNYALYPHMTVADNLGFSLRLAGVERQAIAEKVARAADILHLGPLLRRYPKELSGGQRQRVAMGRAIVRDPQVFLFDEPLSNLDAKLRVVMRAEIKELQGKLRTTTVYVTHDQIEAMTMADRIVVMNGGKVEQIASPLELYDRPANIFVASFIGSPQMNFLNGKVGQGGRHFTLEEGLEVELPQAAGSPPGFYTLGIRPDDIALADSGIPARIAIVEPTGAQTLVHVRTAGKAEIVVSLGQRAALRAGDAVHLRFEMKKSHLFHADGGTRLDWAKVQ